MVGHNRGLPHLYLRIEAVNLWQLLFEDGTPKRAKDNMREVCLLVLRPYVAFEVAEEGMPPLDAKRNHIQAGTAIVLPFRPPVLVVLNLVRR